MQQVTGTVHNLSLLGQVVVVSPSVVATLRVLCLEAVRLRGVLLHVFAVMSCAVL